jgi:hypothetical protein
MHRKAILLGILALFVAGQAGATVMDTWSEVSLQFTNLGRAEASDSAVGVTTVTATASGTHLQSVTVGTVPGLSLNTTIPVTDPIVSNGGIVEVILTSIGGIPSGVGLEGNGATIGNISGAVASTAGGLSPRTLPSDGGVRICLLLTGCAGSFLPLEVGGTSAGLQIGGGVGGVLTIGGTGTIMISILGAPYTVKTITNFNRTNNQSIESFQENGFAHGPGSATSSTAQTSGVLQIVTANHTTTVGVPGNSDISGNFGRLLVHFVPEPGLLLLLGSGAVGMALLGRKRARK